jgi:hypothetical protein
MNNDAAAFGVIRDAVDNPGFYQRFVADPDGVLTEMRITELKSREVLKRVVAGLGGLPADDYTAQQRSTFETAESFKGALRDTVKQIERGFRTTMVMYTVAFYLGVGLIVAATVMAFVKEQALLPIVFGTLGIADLIAYFITKPPQDLQFSRARLAQLQAAFFHWFMDYTNWNGLLMERGDEDSLKRVSAVLMANTEKTMQLIDTYCGSPRATEKMRGER